MPGASRFAVDVLSADVLVLHHGESSALRKVLEILCSPTNTINATSAKMHTGVMKLASCNSEGNGTETRLYCVHVTAAAVDPAYLC